MDPSWVAWWKTGRILQIQYPIISPWIMPVISPVLFHMDWSSMSIYMEHLGLLVSKFGPVFVQCFRSWSSLFFGHRLGILHVETLSSPWKSSHFGWGPKRHLRGRVRGGLWDPHWVTRWFFFTAEKTRAQELGNHEDVHNYIHNYWKLPFIVDLPI